MSWFVSGMQLYRLTWAKNVRDPTCVREEPHVLRRVYGPCFFLGTTVARVKLGKSMILRSEQVPYVRTVQYMCDLLGRRRLPCTSADMCLHESVAYNVRVRADGFSRQATWSTRRCAKAAILMPSVSNVRPVRTDTYKYMLV